MAALFFDIYSERDSHLRPMELEFYSNYKIKTNPPELACMPAPFHFVDNDLAFNANEIDEPIRFVTEYEESEYSEEIVENLNMLQDFYDTDQDFDAPDTPITLSQRRPYLEFCKGPALGDYCLVTGTPAGGGLLNVEKLYNPCIFIKLNDANEESWVTFENYHNVRLNRAWKIFQDLLRFSIDDNLIIFFSIAPTSAFIALE